MFSEMEGCFFLLSQTSIHHLHITTLAVNAAAADKELKYWLNTLIMENKAVQYVKFKKHVLGNSAYRERLYQEVSPGEV